MKLRKDAHSADAALTFRNTMWPLPFLAIVGLIGGYMVGGSAGAITGLLAAAVASAVIGSVTTIFIDTLGGGAVNMLYGMGRRTIGLRDRLAGDLNVVRYHKLGNEFDEALIKIEAILTKDPDFSEALFLKAQILWEGFEDRRGAKEYLLKILRVEPDQEAVFHRWAVNFYRELSRANLSERGEKMK